MCTWRLFKACVSHAGLGTVEQSGSFQFSEGAAVLQLSLALGMDIHIITYVHVQIGGNGKTCLLSGPVIILEVMHGVTGLL